MIAYGRGRWSRNVERWSVDGMGAGREDGGGLQRRGGDTGGVITGCRQQEAGVENIDNRAGQRGVGSIDWGGGWDFLAVTLTP